MTEFDRRVQQLVPHYYQIRIPDHKPHRRLPMLIGLHGYAGDMISMMNVARGIGGEELIVASIQGPHQFLHPALETGNTETVGFGWQTPYRSEDSLARHHQLIRRVIREAAAIFNADAGRVFLMGFSQACAMNYRLAFTHPSLLRGVIGVCGGIPRNFDDPRYKRTAGSVLHIAATRDPYYPLDRARLFEASLRRHADDVTWHEYDSPHAFPRRAIPFIRHWILERVGGDGH